MQQLLRRRTIRYVLIGIVVLAAVWVIALALSRAGKVPVTLVVSPPDSTVTIDGKPAKAGKIYLNKGKHTLKATRKYFSNYIKTIDTATLEKDATIYLLPAPNSPEADAYINSHPEDVQIRAIAGGKEYTDTVEKTNREYPVLTKLPVDAIDYTIDYSVDEQQNVVFEVTLIPVGTSPGSDLYIAQLKEFKALALAWLTKEGVDIKKANISITPDPDKQQQE